MHINNFHAVQHYIWWVLNPCTDLCLCIIHHQWSMAWWKPPWCVWMAYIKRPLKEMQDHMDYFLFPPSSLPFNCIWICLNNANYHSEEAVWPSSISLAVALQKGFWNLKAFEHIILITDSLWQVLCAMAITRRADYLVNRHHPLRNAQVPRQLVVMKKLVVFVSLIKYLYPTFLSLKRSSAADKTKAKPVPN